MVNTFIYIFAFILGSLMGSFLNVVSDRVPAGRSILFGRSSCSWCKTKLAPKDLIPLLSFMLLRAKCRYCSKQLSYYYPLSEFLTGLTFMGVLCFSGVLVQPTGYNIARFVFLLGIASFYIVIFLSDAKYRIIPDKVVFPAIAFVLLGSILFLAYSAWEQYMRLSGDAFGRYLLQVGWGRLHLVRAVTEIGSTLFSASLIALFFRFLIFITRGRGMGFGDIKLGFLIGVVNGFPGNVMAIFFGFVFGAVYSLFFMLLGKKTMKDTIPFGPFLVLGSIVSFVWGSALLHWYLGLV